MPKHLVLFSKRGLVFFTAWTLGAAKGAAATFLPVVRFLGYKLNCNNKHWRKIIIFRDSTSISEKKRHEYAEENTPERTCTRDIFGTEIIAIVKTLGKNTLALEN